MTRQKHPIEQEDWRGWHALLRGEAAAASPWLEAGQVRTLIFLLAVTLAGAAAFGAVVGSWRSPEQGLYVAIKLPLVILATALGNSLLNGMLAPLLGVPQGFRQSLVQGLASLAIASAILGAASPVVAFAVWNLPPLDSAAAASVYAWLLLGLVALITLAGVAANLRLFQLLHQSSGERQAARKVLLAWLAGNLFLGSQVAWILRPFIGNPQLPVQFLRPEAFHGNFYEAVWHALEHGLLR